MTEKDVGERWETVMGNRERERDTHRERQVVGSLEKVCFFRTYFETGCKLDVVDLRRK